LFAVVALCAAIVTAVHHAEVIAMRLGATLGAVVLALAVTVIEVGLILSMMTNDTSDSPTVARDTVFAAVIIVTNGILGVCLLLGGLRHKELEFHAGGTNALLAVLGVLSGLTLVLPNFTTSTAGPTYSPPQLVFASVASLALYGSLLFAQTRSHRAYYRPVLSELGPASGKPASGEDDHPIPSRRKAWLSFGSR
jgi:Ca2+:H+ antiporter